MRPSNYTLDTLSLTINASLELDGQAEENERVLVRFLLADVVVLLEEGITSHAIVQGRFSWAGQQLKVYFRGMWFSTQMKAGESAQHMTCTCGGNETLQVTFVATFSFPPQTPMDQIVNRRFISRGSFGYVFKVRLRNQTMQLAMKEITVGRRLRSDQQPVSIQRARQELIVHLLPINSGVQTFFGWNKQSGMLRIITFFYRGGSLEKDMRAGGRGYHLIDFVHHVCALHRFGLVHMDIKPGNIVVLDDRNGAVYLSLCDFGGTVMSGQQGPARLQFTPTYAASEVKSGIVDSRSDLYSIAITFREINSSHSTKIRIDEITDPTNFQMFMCQIDEWADTVPATRKTGGFDTNVGCIPIFPTLYSQLCCADVDWDLLNYHSIGADFKRKLTFAAEKSMYNRNMREYGSMFDGFSKTVSPNQTGQTTNTTSQSRGKYIADCFNQSAFGGFISVNPDILHPGMSDGLCGQWSFYYFRRVLKSIACNSAAILSFYMKLPSQYVVCRDKLRMPVFESFATLSFVELVILLHFMVSILLSEFAIPSNCDTAQSDLPTSDIFGINYNAVIEAIYSDAQSLYASPSLKI